MSAERGKANWMMLAVAVWFVSALVVALLAWAWFLTEMNEWRVPGVAVLGTACLALLAFAARRLLRQDRQRALVRLARRQGFSLDPQRRPWREAWQADFGLFAGARSVERWNVLTGTWRGLAVEVFDSEAKPRAPAQDEQEPLRRTVASAVLTQELPALIVEPNRTNSPRREGSFITWYGAVDGEMELSDFQRRYVVMAEDNGAATRLLHPDMETFLLEHWNIGLQIVGRRAVFYGERLLRPAEIRQLLDFAAGFCRLIPAHVNRGGEATFGQRDR